MFHTVNKFFPSKTLFDVAQIFSNFAGIIFMLSSSLSKKIPVSALFTSALSEECICTVHMRKTRTSLQAHWQVVLGFKKFAKLRDVVASKSETTDPVIFVKTFTHPAFWGQKKYAKNL